MKFLHTADWHLGRTLYGRKRDDEFTAFLDWLIQTIETHRVDVLLIAGDVFDTGTPSNRAQALYYRFLCQVSASRCRHVVVIGGNHDSPSFLEAPKALLRAINVHVVGAVSDDCHDEVIVLDDGELPPAIVCAVPYLRDKDIRQASPGESIDDKNAKLVAGIKQHYADVCAIAERRRHDLIQAAQAAATPATATPATDIPLIAMGHLFTAGGATVDGDGVRELYVGNLAHVEATVFPTAIDYLALGHLHVPQVVGRQPHWRYSGSPIAMGFGEATQQKQVVVFAWQTASNDAPKLDIQAVPVPCFQPLCRVVGDLPEIERQLAELKKANSNAWLEIEYTGSDVISHLRDVVDEAVSDTDMEVRRLKNRRTTEAVLSRANTNESLDDLTPGDVFARCLDAFDLPTADRQALTLCHDEVLQSLREDDTNAA